MNPQETIDEMRRELYSIDMEEIVLAVAADGQLKRDIHNLLIEHFKERADKGEKFKVTKRQMGLMVVMEGLIIMSAFRKANEQHLNN